MRESTAAGFDTGSSPNTETEPDCARNRPITCLMSVVLPAPFTPTSPNTAPRGIESVTPPSASAEPKRRERLRISTTGRVAALGSAFMGRSLLLVFAAHDFVPFVEELLQLFDVHAHVARVCQQRIDSLAEHAQAFSPRERRGRIGNVSAGGAAFDDDARV